VVSGSTLASTAGSARESSRSRRVADDDLLTDGSTAGVRAGDDRQRDDERPRALEATHDVTPARVQRSIEIEIPEVLDDALALVERS